MLELIDRDANGRICKFTIGKHTIRTPTIMPHFRPAFYKYAPEIGERIRKMLEK
ncbi:MAG: hypothetical protein KJ906_01290 [Nanoarchaeota archaeon]|nr:hypothetical protein [Nanoarchaeota archaeon]